MEEYETVLNTRDALLCFLFTVMLGGIVCGCYHRESDGQGGQNGEYTAGGCNAGDALSSSNEPSSEAFTFPLQYRVIRTVEDVDSLPANVHIVRLENADDEVVDSIVGRQDTTIERIEIIDSTVSDAGLKQLRSVDTLIHIYLLRCPNVTQSGILSLKLLPNLRSVTVLQCAKLSASAHQELTDIFKGVALYRGE